MGDRYNKNYTTFQLANRSMGGKYDVKCQNYLNYPMLCLVASRRGGGGEGGVSVLGSGPRGRPTALGVHDAALMEALARNKPLNICLKYFF